MYNDDFVIMVDESGQPYIAHAFGDGFRRAGSKYLEKVKTKSGMWRYLYTPEEVRALGQARKAKKKGVNSTEDLQSYQVAQYKANQARNRVKGNRAKLKTDTKNKVKDWAGYDERERRNAALAKMQSGTKSDGSKSGKNLDKARKYDFDKAQAEYSKTLLGRADYVKSSAKARSTILKNSIKKHGETTLSSIRDWNTARKNRRQNKRTNNNGGR